MIWDFFTVLSPRKDKKIGSDLKSTQKYTMLEITLHKSKLIWL